MQRYALAMVGVASILVVVCGCSRTIRLQVMAHDSLRTGDHWESEIRRRVKRVTEAFERPAGIRLAVEGVGAWEPGPVTSTAELLSALRLVVQTPKTDILLGLY